MAKELRLDRAGVCRNGRRLLQAGLLEVGNGRISLQKDLGRWKLGHPLARGAGALTNVYVDARQPKRRQGSSVHRRVKESSKERIDISVKARFNGPGQAKPIPAKYAHLSSR
jgi:hypothetical protein